MLPPGDEEVDRFLFLPVACQLGRGQNFNETPKTPLQDTVFDVCRPLEELYVNTAIQPILQ